MEHLENADIWVYDEIFRSCPEENTTHVIFAPVMGKFVPLVCVLLEEKSIKHYENMFCAKKKNYHQIILVTLFLTTKRQSRLFLRFFIDKKFFYAFFISPSVYIDNF